MDKTEWKDIWIRIGPRLYFDDLCTIAEAMKALTGRQLSELNKASSDDQLLLTKVITDNLMNPRKKKKIFLPWLTPYQDETSNSWYNENRIMDFLHSVLVLCPNIDTTSRKLPIGTRLLEEAPKRESNLASYLQSEIEQIHQVAQIMHIGRKEESIS